MALSEDSLPQNLMVDRHFTIQMDIDGEQIHHDRQSHIMSFPSILCIYQLNSTWWCFFVSKKTLHISAQNPGFPTSGVRNISGRATETLGSQLASFLWIPVGLLGAKQQFKRRVDVHWHGPFQLFQPKTGSKNWGKWGGLYHVISQNLQVYMF